MRFTVRDARQLVAPFASSGGECPDSPLVLDRINEATRRLLMNSPFDWAHTVRHVAIETRNRCFTLPREFHVARFVAIDCTPKLILPYGYQYLDSGPWFRPEDRYITNDLLDMGDHWPVFFDVPTACYPNGLPLVFFSTKMEDVNERAVKVWGRDSTGTELLSPNGEPGVYFPILPWEDGVEGRRPSALNVSNLPRVYEVNRIMFLFSRLSYVVGYAYDPDTHAMFFLGKYHPDEVSPAYRRYRILGPMPPEDREPLVVRVLAKLRFVPLRRDEDELLIQNLDALKLMVMSIRAENSGDLQTAMALEARAFSVLGRQLANHQDGSNPIGISVQTDSWLGPVNIV